MTISTLTVTNDMLGLLGELPINDLDTAHPVVPRALQHLSTSNTTVQAQKWWFNCETVSVQPTIEGYIMLPNDTLSADSLERYPNLTVRGNRLYNLDEATDKFTEKMKLRLHRLVAFNDLPITARAYVAAHAKLAFQVSIDGDETKTRLLLQELQDAKLNINSEHTRNTRANMLLRPGVQRILNQIRGTRRL